LKYRNNINNYCSNLYTTRPCLFRARTAVWYYNITHSVWSVGRIYQYNIIIVVSIIHTWRNAYYNYKCILYSAFLLYYLRSHTFVGHDDGTFLFGLRRCFFFNYDKCNDIIFMLCACLPACLPACLACVSRAPSKNTKICKSAVTDGGGGNWWCGVRGTRNPRPCAHVHDIDGIK